MHFQKGKSIKANLNLGFTLVELLVTLSVFAVVTALVLVKYKGFDNSIVLTSLAYDVALTVREAQAYGVNVRRVSEVAPTGGQTAFDLGYGVHFSVSTPDKIYLYVDAVFPPNYRYDYGVGGTPGEEIKVYALKRGARISAICAGNSESSCGTSLNDVDIEFVRPTPTALINTQANSSKPGVYNYAEVSITSADSGETKKIQVYRTGQISIK